MSHAHTDGHAHAHGTTRFARLLDLAKLKWFEEKDGRLKVRDSAKELVAGSIDVHTHLALSYVRRVRVDLFATHDCVQHYLPAADPLDLEPYANLNYTPRALRTMKQDLTLRSMTGTGLRRTHTGANLQREMDDLGLDRSVLLPIELPVLSHNTETYMDVAKKLPRLVPFCSVHPSWKDAGDKLAAYRKAGALGIKLHPNIQNFEPDDPRVMKLYGIAGDLGLPVLLHAGPVGIETAQGRRNTQMKHYWVSVRSFPKTTFILGHAGALQWDMALELAQRYRNTWLEISSQGLAAVQQLVIDAPPDRLMFGSDWPFYHQGIPLAKLLLATEGRPDARRRILRDNARALLGLGS